MRRRMIGVLCSTLLFAGSYAAETVAQSRVVRLDVRSDEYQFVAGAPVSIPLTRSDSDLLEKLHRKEGLVLRAFNGTREELKRAPWSVGTSDACYTYVAQIVKPRGLDGYLKLGTPWSTVRCLRRTADGRGFVPGHFIIIVEAGAGRTEPIRLGPQGVGDYFDSGIAVGFVVPQGMSSVPGPVNSPVNERVRSQAAQLATLEDEGRVEWGRRLLAMEMEMPCIEVASIQQSPGRFLKLASCLAQPLRDRFPYLVDGARGQG